MLTEYYRLTKPGIIYGNMLTAIAGFLFASGVDIDWVGLVGMTVGLSLVIAAACVCNNILDRHLDEKMKRTRTRALVSGRISPAQASLYAAALLAIGITALVLLTNLLALMAAVLGFVFYVVVYGGAKRLSIYGTEAGSISGAAPIVTGYVAASGQFDIGALLIFLALVTWQMPHFYAIALYRAADYKAASIPVLPLVKGVRQTKIRMVIYIVAFALVIIAVFASGYAGVTFLAVMLVAVSYWLYAAYRDRKASDTIWGRRMFGMSLKVLLVFSLLISVDAWLV